MRVLLFILFLGISAMGYSGFGYKLKQVSLFYGEIYYFQSSQFNTFEFQYDIQKSGCKGVTPYFGAGLVFGFNQNQKILGIKGMYNPTRIGLTITRKYRIHPYIFGQGIMIWTNKKSAKSDYTFVPGIGLNGVFRISDKIHIRPQFQLGYNLNENVLPRNNNLVIEIKLGIGINSRVFKRTKKDKE